MRRLLIALCLVVFPATALPAGEYPPYLLLRAPEKPQNKHDTQGYYPGRGYTVETHAYNYGWFGAKYGRTWQRSFGHHRNYTQWKVK